MRRREASTGCVMVFSAITRKGDSQSVGDRTATVGIATGRRSSARCGRYETLSTSIASP